MCHVNGLTVDMPMQLSFHCIAVGFAKRGLESWTQSKEDC